MSRSTGPILAAGGITWANNVLLSENASSNRTGGGPIAKAVEDDFFTGSVRIAVATGLAVGMLYMVETLAGDLAVALSWAALTTVLFVRVGNNPTPMERAVDLAGLMGA